MAVAQFPKPTNIHQIRQYIGLTGYFRRFIPNYASLSKPLSVLLSKNSTWYWEKPQDEAFEKLTNVLTSVPVLALFKPALEIRLYTDASRLGVAGILVQVEGSTGRLP